MSKFAEIRRQYPQTTFSEIRRQYPEYDDMSDEELLVGLHRKFSPDVPFPQFLEESGMGAEVAAKQAAADVGPAEAVLLGAGHSADRLWEGAKQLVGLGESPEEMASRAAIFSELQRERPIATATGEAVPFLAAGGIAGGGRSLLSGLARQGGAAAGVGGAMHGTAEERAMNAMIEGATSMLGEAGGRALSRALGLGIKPSPGGAANIESAKAMGFQVMPTTGTEAGRLAQTLQGGLESSPGGALAFAGGVGENQVLLNRYAAQAIGENADAVTDSVIDAAFERIGGEFNRLMSPDVKIKVTDDLTDTVDRIAEERIAPYLVGPGDPVGVMVDRATKFLDEAGDEIPANVIQSQVSMLDRFARARMRSNPDLAFALRDMKDALLRAAKESMSDENAQALDTARAQYRKLAMMIEGKAIEPVTGSVSAGKLASELERRDKRGWTRGKDKSPLYEAVRFMARQQPDLATSGTAERSALMKILGMAAGGAGLGFAGEGGMTPMEGGLGALALTAAAPYAAARLYLNPATRAWMMRSASPLTQDITRQLGLLGAQVGMGPSP